MFILYKNKRKNKHVYFTILTSYIFYLPRMKNTYYEYLQSLNKEELIRLVYSPFEQIQTYPGISKRRIALRLSYHGENYKGVQHHKNLYTVFGCLQNALKLTEIIPEESKIVFCGRTDAGVNAISMVVSLDVHSRISNPNRTFQLEESDYEEYPYDVILNMMLPEDIRVTGWAPASDDFNARYDCVQRQYRYYFLLNNLNMRLMEEAVDKIGKMEDFYELSTHSNPKANYKRKLDYIKIVKVENDDIKNKIVKVENEDIKNTDNVMIVDEMNKLKITTSHNIKDYSDDLYCLEIAAPGFLHNMVRKIFWVIQNSGKGNGIILRNVEIAPPEPLVFVGAKFKENLNFIGNRYNKILFKREEELSRIKHAISKLRLEKYDC